MSTGQDQFEQILHSAFPFHLRIGGDGTISDAGRSLRRVLPDVVGLSFFDRFEVRRPGAAQDWATFRRIRNTLVLIADRSRDIVLRGQLEELDGDLLFLGSPWFTSAAELTPLGLTFGDFAPNDPVLDLVVEVQLAGKGLSEARLLLSRLEHERTRAEEAARTRGHFLATISHELRTPLNAILGMSSLLLDTPLDARQVGCVDTVRSSGAQLLELVNQILDFTKIESGSMELESEAFEVLGCVEEAIDLVSRSADEKGLALVFTIAPGTASAVRGDITRLRQVLVNLLSNAVKFTEKGRVTMQVEQHDGQLRFRVEDTGIGIEPEQLERIFEPFAQASSAMTRRFGGTGLGLSISRRLVELMGGRLDVTSQLGLGSVFEFAIPLPPVSHDRASAAEFTGSKLAVVVRDESYRRCISAVAAALGAGVVSGSPRALAEADASGASSKPDVVVVCDSDDRAALAPVFARWPGVPMVTVRCSPTDVRDESSWLRMPVRRGPLARALRLALGRETPTPTVVHSSIPPLQVLVVDDNLTNQKVTLALLERMKLRADAVSSGHEAIATLRLRPYDLVLMDVQMPEMDGLEATRRIRAGGANRDVRIVALTANAFAEDEKRCLEAGMDGFLTKPIRLEDLRTCIKNHAVEVGKPSASRGAPLPTVDRARIAELGLEGKLLAVIADAYVKDAHARLSTLRGADGADMDRIRATAHALKGSSSNLGVRRVEAMCIRLESGAEALTPAWLDELAAEIASAESTLREVSA